MQVISHKSLNTDMVLPDNFLQEETRQGYTISHEMKEVWAVSMDMAERLIDVCQRHGLKCWMDSGTLLGAVREGGFIPWDDDIDFVMLRKDYDKLVKIAADEFQPPYFFQTTYSDVDHYCGHAQLRRIDTTSLLKCDLNKKHCQGIFVDIFVLDGFIENPLLRFLHRTTAMLMRKTIHGCLRLPEENTTFGRKMSSFLGKAICRIIPYRRLFAWQEAFFRMVDADRHRRVSVISYRYSTHRRIRLRSSYDEMVWIPFEGQSFPAPNNTDDALRCYFGSDYMTPRQEPTAHGEMYLDARMPYPEAISLLRQHPEKFDERLRLLYHS